MTVKRMDNIGIVVEDMDNVISFFTELGLNLEGRTTVEGDWSERVTGLRDMRCEIAMMVTPDGRSRLELSRFEAPPIASDHRNALVNALGYLRVMFAVEDLGDTLARLYKLGAELVDEVVQYEDAYRLCYIRGPEGILIGLAQELGPRLPEPQISRGASIPNPALEPFSVLVGNWNTVGTHGQLPDAVLHGRASFAWLENGAFLISRSELSDPRFPGGISVIGSDDSTGEYFMLYFDERGVSRKYQVTLHDNIWKWWRSAPGFFQRYEGTIVDGGSTIIVKGELSKDGLSWDKDLDLTYERIK